MLRIPFAAPGSVTARRLLLLATLSFLPIAASAQTVDDILEKYIAARGGLAKIKAIQSERVTGTMVFSPEVQGPFVVERERPLKLHMEVTVGRDTVIRVYDGKSAGWVYNPFASNPATVRPMTENDLRSIQEEADFEGPFINYKAKGNQLEYVEKLPLKANLRTRSSSPTKMAIPAIFLSTQQPTWLLAGKAPAKMARAKTLPRNRSSASTAKSTRCNTRS